MKTEAKIYVVYCKRDSSKVVIRKEIYVDHDWDNETEENRIKTLDEHWNKYKSFWLAGEDGKVSTIIPLEIR